MLMFANVAGVTGKAECLKADLLTFLTWLLVSPNMKRHICFIIEKLFLCVCKITWVVKKCGISFANVCGVGEMQFYL